MTATGKFVNAVLKKTNSGEIKKARQRIAGLEAREGKDAGVAAGGDSIAHDDQGITFTASEFPSQDLITWLTDDGGLLVARIIGFQVSGTSGGAYLLGVEKDVNHYGVSGLAVQGNAQALGEYEVLLQIDTQGNTARVFMEQLDGAVYRRSYLPAAGWTPLALPMFLPQSGVTADTTLAANGGAIATPVFIAAPMLLQSVVIRNNNVSGQRTWNWTVYQQFTNTGDSAENTLTRASFGTAAETFTASGTTTREITADSAPAYLGPGVYWLVIQCQHASNNFIIRTEAGNVPNIGNVAQTKTITNPMGSTLDFVAATWTKGSDVPHASLKGRVFGQTSAF